ncbi:MAG: hypothetical protein GXO81_00315 [Chlorobi bacterium]|nr:hypothetical protein [Chlorobiota bacterium]
MAKFKKNLSKYSIVFSVLLVVFFIITARFWRDDGKIIASDVIDYYSYLPATFIFHDIGINKAETIENGRFYTKRLPNGNNVIKMSMGMSFIYAPFFFAGHVYALITGEKANGFSVPYRIALLFGAVLYFILGLIFLRKILLRFFSENITALTILAIAIGTNLSYYASNEATMSHLYNFSLITVFIWHTIRWHESQTVKRLVGLGALAGLITLIRPSNIIILLFFFLYNVYSWDGLKEKFLFVARKFHWFIFMLIAFLLVWIPQFIYNIVITDHLLFYSYVDERFFFNNPQILDGLFSYRKGWLVYTPMMAIAILGIPILFFKMKEFSVGILVFMVINIYITFSWWCWWYGGSFGQRPMVDSYGMMSIPFALVLSELWKLRKWLYKTAVVIIIALILLNNFMFQKYMHGSIHFADMTKEAFWHSFWSVRAKPGFYDLLETPDYKKARKGIYVIKERKPGK